MRWGRAGRGRPGRRPPSWSGGGSGPGSRVLAGMKTEAILYASEGVSTSIIAKMVERTERTVQEWPAEWQGARMRPVPAGHAENQNAAEPARARKQEPETILARPSSRTGARTGFRDAPALREVVKILSDAEHQSDSSYQLLLRLCGPSPEPPDPFDEHHDETTITRRMAEATTQVKSLLDQGWKVHTARLRPAPSTRPRPAACSPRKRAAHQTGPWTGGRRPSPSSAPSR